MNRDYFTIQTSVLTYTLSTFSYSLKLIFLTWIILITALNGRAQDIHWAHIHASPTYLNPAMTGVISGGNIRLIANARSQWNSFTKGYKTAMASGDFQIAPAGESGFIGAGMNLFADQAGDLDFTTTKVGFMLSVVKALDGKGDNLVSLGMQSDFIRQSLDYTKMFGFEEETIAFDGTPNKIGYHDLSVGAAWFYSFRWHSSIYLGASYAHFTEPDVAFRSGATVNPGEVVPYYRKLIIHGGGDLRMGNNTTILPSALFMDQGPHQEINLGSFVKFNRDASFNEVKQSFYLGAWLRWYMERDLAGAEAVIFSFRYDHGTTSFTFSYDTNISSLRRASVYKGGPEISIVQVLGQQGTLIKGNSVKCPAF